mmetsp:Transcript_11761/g.42987  ORF Transcript_11761/g.42987 Transcript_11761/m.42987 type:complete len:294 (+) Transcript_11761:103-984(+)
MAFAVSQHLGPPATAACSNRSSLRGPRLALAPFRPWRTAGTAIAAPHGKTGLETRRLPPTSAMSGPAFGAGSDEQPEEDRFDIRKAEALLEKEGLPEEYRRKIEQKIADEEARLEAAEATAREILQAGIEQYSRGRYSLSVKCFEKALEYCERFSVTAGEIQLWLAMGFDASGRRDESISLYRKLEKTHPDKNISKQAAELRFIAEAPKMEIRPEERVTIPEVQVYSGGTGYGIVANKVREVKRKKLKQKAEKGYELDWDPFDLRPRWLPTKVIYVLAAAWVVLTIAALRQNA